MDICGGHLVQFGLLVSYTASGWVHPRKYPALRTLGLETQQRRFSGALTRSRGCSLSSWFGSLPQLYDHFQHTQQELLAWRLAGQLLNRWQLQFTTSTLHLWPGIHDHQAASKPSQRQCPTTCQRATKSLQASISISTQIYAHTTISTTSWECWSSTFSIDAFLNVNQYRLWNYDLTVGQKGIYC